MFHAQMMVYVSIVLHIVPDNSDSGCWAYDCCASVLFGIGIVLF
jgi:hypothetical protein